MQILGVLAAGRQGKRTNKKGFRDFKFWFSNVNTLTENTT